MPRHEETSALPAVSLVSPALLTLIFAGCLRCFPRVGANPLLKALVSLGSQQGFLLAGLAALWWRRWPDRAEP